MKRSILAAACAFLFLLFAAGNGALRSWQGETVAPAAPKRVIHQLRVYEIFDGNKKAFHERFSRSCHAHHGAP